MFEVITIKTDGLGVTSDDVNRLKLSLDRQRSLSNDGMTIARLSCYTDDPTGLDEGIRVITLMKDPEIIHDEWYQALLFDGDMKGLRDESKCTYINAKVVARQMCTSVIYKLKMVSGVRTKEHLPVVRTKEHRPGVRTTEHLPGTSHLKIMFFSPRVFSLIAADSN